MLFVVGSNAVSSQGRHGADALFLNPHSGFSVFHTFSLCLCFTGSFLEAVFFFLLLFNVIFEEETESEKHLE